MRKCFFTALTTVIKKDPTTSIRKHAYELKVHKKTMRTGVKSDLSLDFNCPDFALWDIFDNKTNANSHPNIGSLKIAIKEV